MSMIVAALIAAAPLAAAPLTAALIAAAPLQDLAVLGARVADFSGGPAAIDPRLRLAACAQPPVIAWRAGAPGTVTVDCSAPVWRIFAGTRAALAHAPVAPGIRRGDAVTVAAAGAGYRVTIDAVAEADGVPGGRLRVRDTATGARLSVEVQPDGSVTLPGYSLAPAGR